MNNSYLEYRRALKLGNGSPGSAKQAKSADLAADEEKDAETPGPAKSPEKAQKSIKKSGAKKKGMRKVSKKRAKENRAYTPVKKKFLTENPFCQAQLEGCTGKATDLHHAAGRTGKQLLNVTDFVALCRSCHDKMEADDKAARATGLKKTRLGKANK